MRNRSQQSAGPKQKVRFLVDVKTRWGFKTAGTTMEMPASEAAALGPNGRRSVEFLSPVQAEAKAEPGMQLSLGADLGTGADVKTEESLPENLRGTNLPPVDGSSKKVDEIEIQRPAGAQSVIGTPGAKPAAAQPAAQKPSKPPTVPKAPPKKS